MSQKATELMSRDIRASVEDVTRMGGSLADISTLYKDISEQSGRLTQLTNEEIRLMTAIAKGTDIFAGDIAKMTEHFSLLGVNIEKSAEYVGQIFEDSQAMGLNARKVISTLQTNMKQMSAYSFKDGVKGMMEMAKQAVNMRMEVGEMLGMADKFYNPEGAIEAAAQLQLMGGDIAAAFGDPFETMYLARNKPEELAKRVQDMTENMMQFNESTGEFEMPAEARQQLKFTAEQLGLNADNMTAMARQASKLKTIKMDIGGNVFDDENTLSALSNIAKFKDGEWMVEVRDEAGNQQQKLLENLTETEAKKLLEREDTTEKDSLFTIAQNTMTLDQTLGAINESLMMKAAGESGIYEKSFEEFLKPGLKHFEESANRTYDLTMKAIMDKNTGMTDLLKDAFGVKPGSGDNIITKAVDRTLEQYNEALRAELKKLGGGDVTIKTESALLNATTAVVTGKVEEAEDIVYGGDGTVVMGGKGAFRLDPADQYAVGSDGTLVAGTNLLGNAAGVNKMSGSDKGLKLSVDPLSLNINIDSGDGLNPQVDKEKLSAEIGSAIQRLFSKFSTGKAWNGNKETAGFADNQP